MLVEVLPVHLFNVVVNLATSKFNDRFGFTVNDLKLKFLAFADDLLLFADSQVGAPVGLLDILIEDFGLAELNLNVKKCFSMAKCHKKKWVCLTCLFSLSIISPFFLSQ